MTVLPTLAHRLTQYTITELYGNILQYILLYIGILGEYQRQVTHSSRVLGTIEVKVRDFIECDVKIHMKKAT